MIYANNKSGEKILATPNSKAQCPLCEKELIPKCGDINVWHWSHKSLTDCDNWAEGETKWHRDWKAIVKPKFCEVKIGKHRADIVNGNGIIIELQNSPISTEKIIEREHYYKNMFWVFNGQEFYKNLTFIRKNKYMTFRWKQPRKSHWYISQRLFWDFGANGMFQVKKIYDEIPCRGWGLFIEPFEFIDLYLKTILKKDI